MALFPMNAGQCRLDRVMALFFTALLRPLRSTWFILGILASGWGFFAGGIIMQW
jgi:hypothetical protein